LAPLGQLASLEWLAWRLASLVRTARRLGPGMGRWTRQALLVDPVGFPAMWMGLRRAGAQS
jgi:hypothetical protein